MMKALTRTSLFTRSRKRLLTQCAAAALFSLASLDHAFSQGVGINTTTPDPSAALDIQSDNKGILIPRVSLQTGSDVTTVPNPATGLLVYNTNPALSGGIGFYYNINKPTAPDWRYVGELRLPINQSMSTSNDGGTVFRLNDFGSGSSSKTIHAYSQNGYALHTDGKIQITGNGQQPGSGKVLTSDASGNAFWAGGIAFSITGILQNGAHILAPNTVYKVPFGTERYDKSDSYTLHTQNPADTFIVPENGIYHFDVKVDLYHSSVFATVALCVVRNGAVEKISEQNIEEQYLCSIDLDLQKDDQVYVTIVHQYNNNISLDNGSYFSGRFVQSNK